MISRSRGFKDWLTRARLETPSSIISLKNDLPVLVIGAGPAGLAVMYELTQKKISFEAVERHTQVGGLWDNTNSESAAYDHLMTNSSKSTTSLEAAPFEGKSEFISRKDAFSYLTQYAERKNLKPQIRFRTEVVSATRILDAELETWEVTLKDLESQTQTTEKRVFRAIICATGHNARSHAVLPKNLTLKAQEAHIPFKHSVEYRNPNQYLNKNVVIVGVGNSGADIATEVSKVASQTFLIARSIPWFVPMKVFGIPSDLFAKILPSWTPQWLKTPAFQFLQWIYVGFRISKRLEKPNHKLLQKHPVSDCGISRAIAQGRVQVKAGFADIRDGQVWFESPPRGSGGDGDGDGKKVDEIIFATGFKRKFSYLGHEDFNEDLKFSFLIFHPTKVGLMFMNETPLLQGVWPIFVEQAKAISAYLRAAGVENEQFKLFSRLRAMPNPDFKSCIYSQADEFHVDTHSYTDGLRRLCRWFN